MQRVRSEALREIAAAVFRAIGSSAGEAGKVAARLVEANLTGHDSHGVIRVPQYVTQVRDGRLQVNRRGEVVAETEALAVVDGGHGFGQVVAEDAVALAIDKARRLGLGMAALRNSGHVGRLGDWVEMAAAADMASIHFCNGVGSWNLVVPYGGRDPRTSTNPFAVGMPVPGGDPVVLDFATSAIAEGKVRVALNKGVEVPEGCLLDKAGEPTRDPAALYDGGALMPFGHPVAGHKGGGLQLMCDLLAGLLSMGRCAHEVDAAGRPWFSNHLVSLVVAPAVFAEMGGLAAEARRFVEFVKSSRPMQPGGEVLVPGEPERRNRAERSAAGIPLDPNTWNQLLDTAESVGLDRAGLEQGAGGAR